MAFNKNNKKIVTTALTAAMVASAVAPVAAATKTVTPAQAATKAVDAYYKLSVKTKADVSNSAKVKAVALKAIAKLGKKDAKLKASLTKKVTTKSAAINKFYKELVAKEAAAAAEKAAIATAKAALEAAKAFPITADTKVEDVEKMFTEGMALINKIKTASVKADLTKQAEELKAAVLKKIEELKVVKIVTATVVDVNKVEVKFNSAIDTTKATVALKKGLATQYTTVTWAADKKSAVLEAPAAIPTGDYEVVLSGLEAEVKAAVKVEAVVEKTAEVTSAAGSLAASSTFIFKVANQYGTDMKVAGNDVTVQAYNVTQNKAVTVVSKDLVKSEFALNLLESAAAAKDFKVGDDVRIIVTYKGLTTTKTIKINEVSKFADVSLGNVEFKKDTVRVTQNEKDLVLPYTLKDQFGSEKKFAANLTAAGITATGVTFLSSDNTVIDPANITTDADGKLLVDTENKSGTVVLTAIINGTGKVATTTVKVEAGSAVKTVAVNAPTKLVAGGEKATLDFSVVDQFGSLIKNDDAKVTALTLSSSDQTIVKDANIKFVNGKLEATTEAAGKGSVTVTVKSGVTEVGKITFTVEEKAKATAIVGVDTSALFEDTATSTLTFAGIKVKDQYGRDYTLAAGDSVAVAHKDGTDDNVKFSITGGDNNLDSGETLTFLGTAATATEVIKFTLANQASFEVSLASVAANAVTSYSIKTVGPIYKDAAHKATLELVGKTADGKEVVLTGNKVTHATTSDSTVATVTTAGVVTGVAKGTATIALWNGSTKLAETVVTVSDVAPVASKVEFLSTLPSSVVDTDDLTGFVKITDQYGVDITSTELAKGFWTTNASAVATFPAGIVTKGNGGKVTVGYVTSNGLVATKEITVQ